MKSSTVFVVLIVILIAFVCCITAACGLGVVVYIFSNPNDVIDFKSYPQIGQVAPDFQLETIEGVRDFIAESNFGFMVLAGSESVARQYNIRAYPTSFFIDEHGVIQSMVVGGLSGPGLDAELEKIGVGE